jgi:hypothetical protein
MLRKTVKERGADLKIVDASKIIRRLFRLYGADYLLN